MDKAPKPANEAERLVALDTYQVLDSLPEQAYDDIALLAARICQTPIALVSLIDEERQWFKSSYGLPGLNETPRDVAFCAHAIVDQDRMMVIEDAQQDARFSDNPMVTGAPHVRFYAGAPLVDEAGYALGTLCVIDTKPNTLNDEQLTSLSALARQVVTHLDLRRAAKQLSLKNNTLQIALKALQKTNTRLERSQGEMTNLIDLLKNQADVIERDLHRAEIIQRSLLPHEIPPMDDYHVQTLYRPGHSIGGDLYDAQLIDDRYLAMVIADAAGHGVSAALLSVLFKYQLQLQDPDSGAPLRPSLALTRINASLRASSPAPGAFVTAQCCLLDTHTGRLRFSSAGHPPMLRISANGDAEEFAPTGPALGLETDALYTETEIALTPKDRVLLYTDGLLDISPQMVETSELAQTLAGCEQGENTLASLLGSVTDEGIRPDCDDITLILLAAQPGANVCDVPIEPLHLSPANTEEEPTIYYVESADATMFTIHGRLTWFYGQGFFDAAIAALDSDRDLVIDLEHCEFLDSTLLGTLHELVISSESAGRQISLQNLNPKVRDSFIELSMFNVLQKVSRHPVSSAEIPVRLDLSFTEGDRQRSRLLKAHEMLAGLSEHNRSQFADLVQMLQNELRDSG